MTEQQALSRLTAECAKAEHCSGEMLDKMRRWEINDSAKARIMQYLTDHQYIDDTRFTRMFIRDKMRFNRWGRRKIEQALWAKHVSEEIYRPLLDEIEEKEWKTLLLPLLESKRKTTKAQSDYERNMKLTKFAISRGFTADIIRKCIDNSNVTDDED